MAREIERKFLVKNDNWKSLAEGTFYRQGYIMAVHHRTVRVRTMAEQAFLTIKGPSKGLARAEFEYEIPLSDANEMLDTLCEKPIIEKYRYKIEYKSFLWEVDLFEGDNKGLIIAEVELESEDQPFEKPDWIGEEVSGEQRYFNAYLIKHPFSTW